MSPPLRAILVLGLVTAAGGVAWSTFTRERAVTPSFTLASTVLCQSASPESSGSLYTWYVRCEDGAKLSVQLPDGLDGGSALRFERGPDGLRFPYLTEARSLYIGGCTTTPIELPALTSVSGDLVVVGCDSGKFLERIGRGMKGDQLSLRLPSLIRAGKLEISILTPLESFEAPMLKHLNSFKVYNGALAVFETPKLERIEELAIVESAFDQCALDRLLSITVKPDVKGARFSPCNLGRGPAEALAALEAEDAVRREAGSPCPPHMALIPHGRPDGGAPVADFCLDVTEVTLAAWPDAGVRQPDDSPMLTHCERPNGSERPIDCVKAEDASGFCARLGKRLPTLREWQWAAHGASRQTRYPWGNEGFRHRACVQRMLPDFPYRRPGGPKEFGSCVVASYPRGVSPQGVYDLLGNLTEWVTTDGGLIVNVGAPYNAGEGDFESDQLNLKPSSFRITNGFRCAQSL